MKKQNLLLGLFLVLSLSLVAGCGGGGYGGVASGPGPVLPTVNPPVVGVSARGGAASVVPGGTTTALVVTLDASKSPQEADLLNLPVAITVTGGTLGDIHRASLFAGDTKLASVIPAPPTATTTTVNFNPELYRLSPGKDPAELRVVLQFSPASAYGMAVSASLGSDVLFEGASSGQRVGATSVDTTTTTTMTVTKVTYEIGWDPSSPSTRLAAAGETVRLGVVRETPMGAPCALAGIGFVLPILQGTLSYLRLDDGYVAGASEWSDNPTTITAFSMKEYWYRPEWQQTRSVLSVTIATGTPDGTRVQVGFTTHGTAAYDTISGTKANLAIDTRLTAPVTVYRSYPDIRLEPLPTVGLADGRAIRFSVGTHSSGPIGNGSFCIRISTTERTSFSGACLVASTSPAYAADFPGPWYAPGVVAPTAELVGVDTYRFTVRDALSDESGGRSTVPVWSYRQRVYYELRLNAFGPRDGSMVATLLGDYAPPAGPSGLLSESDAEAASWNFIWSPAAVSPSIRRWTNGAYVPGLPSSGLIQVRTF